MTCRRNDLHPLDALYGACTRYPGGIEALALRLRCSKPALYNKLRTAVDSHRVGYCDELSEILFCLEEAKVEGWADSLHALAWRHGHAMYAVPTAKLDDDKITSAICKSVSEHADAVSKIGEAMLDRVVKRDEMQRVELEVAQAISALAALRALVRQQHSADLAAGRA